MPKVFESSGVARIELDIMTVLVPGGGGLELKTVGYYNKAELAILQYTFVGQGCL